MRRRLTVMGRQPIRKGEPMKIPRRYDDAPGVSLDGPPDATRRSPLDHLRGGLANGESLRGMARAGRRRASKASR